MEDGWLVYRTIHMHGTKKGFTLIEVLVVIAIIALLVSIVYPSLHQAMAAAKRTQCAANLHAVAVAFRMYLNQSYEIMPLAAQMPSLKLNDNPRIADVLGPYLASPQSLKCPADTKDYYISEGSSYEYQSTLGGQKVSDSFLSKRWGEQRTPVMNDYKPFHGKAGTEGAMNFLFADGHVDDLIK